MLSYFFNFCVVVISGVCSFWLTTVLNNILTTKQWLYMCENYIISSKCLCIFGVPLVGRRMRKNGVLSPILTFVFSFCSCRFKIRVGIDRIRSPVFKWLGTLNSSISSYTGLKWPYVKVSFLLLEPWHSIFYFIRILRKF